MQGLLDHNETAAKKHLSTEHIENKYKIYFGLGLCINLTHAPKVFKVSQAGIKLGDYLVRSLDSSAFKQSFLDLGTGTGVHALLMRKLGNNDITATDISEISIKQAKFHENLNFKNNKIEFHTGDLFEDLSERRFQTIVFNPPGWRTPSQALINKLRKADPATELPIQAMFYGDEVVSRFLEQLPAHLNSKGKAIIGLNSLIGIQDVLSRYIQKHRGTPPLAYKLIERHTIPLLYYSNAWQSIEKSLKEEFEKWSKQDLAAYSTDAHGNIFWSYEIIELYHRTT
ncbi:methyltransferase [Pseudomonas rhodesiae]|uniref:methyltransferase n=1 Tax=Pseudomonas rhodesiae TaxID=76760 RepID=UPI001BCED345|nr:methyltransferase [Pseudomonas rhodesiae]QVM99418.1 methyltransferase [Pseudomonas rhodesiae]WLG37259.1 methyltransferase [Pseudomonas rhodesiae]